MSEKKGDPRITVVTAVFNGAPFIGDCLASVRSQTYPGVEHIVIDGGSMDGTIGIVRSEGTHVAKFLSEPDRGIYDALNKGIGLATGDVIGFLHADDAYASQNVLQQVVDVMSSRSVDSCYGDLVYVSKQDRNRVIRYWRCGQYYDGLMIKGWMPPHPTFFVRREIYGRHGLFDTSFSISADYELMLRFLENHRITTAYLPEVLVRMRMGGKSNRSIGNMIRKTREDLRAWETNGLRRKWYTIPLKNVLKLPQFFRTS